VPPSERPRRPTFPRSPIAHGHRQPRRPAFPTLPLAAIASGVLRHRTFIIEGARSHHHRHPASRLALPLSTIARPLDLVLIGGGTRSNSSKGYDYEVSDQFAAAGHISRGIVIGQTPWPCGEAVAGVWGAGFLMERC
jgi:hypothetical protein